MRKLYIEIKNFVLWKEYGGKNWCVRCVFWFVCFIKGGEGLLILGNFGGEFWKVCLYDLLFDEDFVGERERLLVLL